MQRQLPISLLTEHEIRVLSVSHVSLITWPAVSIVTEAWSKY